MNSDTYANKMYKTFKGDNYQDLNARHYYVNLIKSSRVDISSQKPCTAAGGCVGGLVAAGLCLEMAGTVAR